MSVKHQYPVKMLKRYKHTVQNDVAQYVCRAVDVTV